MSPEWLLEAALLLGGITAAAIALRLLFTPRRGRAVGVGVAGLAMIIFAFVLGKSEWLHPQGARWLRGIKGPAKPFVLSPATGGGQGDGDSETFPSVSLVLGGVLVQVAPSDRYVLSVEGQEFLVLDSLATGLIVDCDAARGDWIAARIRRNWFVYHGAGVDLGKPDGHTLVARQSGDEIVRIRYAAPGRVEVAGEFLPLGRGETPVIHMTDGIHWSGGGVPPGATVDLSQQGEGRIDFGRSGLIQIKPR